MLRQCLRPYNTRPLRRTSFPRTASLRHVSASTKSNAQRQSQPPLRSSLYNSLKRPFTRASASLDTHIPIWRSGSRILLGFFLSYHIFTSYFFAFSPCDGISMLPTLNSYGDWVLISKYYRRGRGVTVGDLVSFHHPVDEGVEGVKRVLGLEGDFVLLDSPGTNGKMIQVPQGHCWLVGDNLKYSRDSRLFGPLPMALIRGKIVARYTPWTSMQWMKNGLRDVSDEDDVD